MKSSVFMDPGLKLSATRVVFIIWCAVVLLIWTLVSITSWQLAEIPQSVVTVLGLLAGVKATQRFTEGKTDTATMTRYGKTIERFGLQQRRKKTTKRSSTSARNNETIE